VGGGVADGHTVDGSCCIQLPSGCAPGVPATSRTAITVEVGRWRLELKRPACLRPQ
jgi:hypothetical protein